MLVGSLAFHDLLTIGHRAGSVTNCKTGTPHAVRPLSRCRRFGKTTGRAIGGKRTNGGYEMNDLQACPRHTYVETRFLLSTRPDR